MPENSILVIRGGAIGDFILTLPVLAVLRRQFPKTRLEVLGYPHIAQLAMAGGLADRVWPIEARGLAGFFARGGELASELRDYFASFAIIVSFLYDPDGVFETNVKRCTRAQFIAGPHRPDDNAGLHATEVFLKPLERLAIFDADPVPRLVLGSRPSPIAHRLALHPGSGSERKNWPEARWAGLLDRLSANTAGRFLLIGGEAEAERFQWLASRLPRERIETAFNLPLSETAARLAACAGFVGHDSGMTHLAAALGLSGVALWAETPEAVWKPRSERFELLRGGAGLAGVSVDAAFAAVARLATRPPVSRSS